MIEEDREEKNDNEDNNYFFETLFSLDNIENNLIYLKIYFKKANILEPILFEKINNFKSLRYLYIKNFKFENNLNINLENIKILSCKNCKNINISENFGIKWEKLDLEENEISIIESLESVNFKELKELNLNDNYISDIKVLEKVKIEKLEIFLQFLFFFSLSWIKVILFILLKSIFNFLK